jgi:hypothetical protein
MPAVSARPMIEVQGVTKRFGAIEAVRGVSFTVTRRDRRVPRPERRRQDDDDAHRDGHLSADAGNGARRRPRPATDPLACRRAVGYFPSTRRTIRSCA